MHEFATINGLAFVMVRLRELQEIYVRFLATLFLISYRIRIHSFVFRSIVIGSRYGLCTKDFENNQKFNQQSGGMRREGLPAFYTPFFRIARVVRMRNICSSMSHLLKRMMTIDILIISELNVTILSAHDECFQIDVRLFLFLQCFCYFQKLFHSFR